MLFAFLSLLLAAQGQDQKPESYSGVAIGTGGSVGGKSIQFELRITSYTTDDELNQFAALLKEQGQDALLNALNKVDKGNFSPVGRLGNKVLAARKEQQGTDTIITVVTARVMSLMELYNNGRSKDYPFGYMQIKLSQKGQGTGQIMAAAKIRFDKKKGNYEIESFGNQYIKATNVRPSN
jgi:hypothetical protein